jgi:hypothetical protein
MMQGVKKKVNSVLEGLGLGSFPLVQRGEDSNTFKALMNMYETRLYGLRNKGSVAANEIASNLTTWTVNLLLGFNYLNAGGNLMAGQLQNRVDAMAGQHVNNKDLNFAHGQYMSSLHVLAADMGKIAPTSKLGLLAERLNPRSDWQPVANQFVRNNVMKRLYAHLDPNLLQSAGEQAIQLTMMVAVLHNAKALSSTGKFLDKSFNETTDEAQAITMFDAYDGKNPDGSIRMHPAVDGFYKNGVKVEGRDQIEFHLSRFVRELNKSIQGNYDTNEIIELRRGPFGKLAMVMRRWYPISWLVG